MGRAAIQGTVKFKFARQPTFSPDPQIIQSSSISGPSEHFIIWYRPKIHVEVPIESSLHASTPIIAPSPQMFSTFHLRRVPFKHLLLYSVKPKHPIHASYTTTTTAMSSLDQQKRTTRRIVKDALAALSTDQMAKESAAIASKFLAAGFLNNITHAAIYVHCPRLREVDTTPILNAALNSSPPIRVYVPRVLPEKGGRMHFLHLDSASSLIPAPPYGILEPTLHYKDGSLREDILTSSSSSSDDDARLQLIVMPGLAFDTQGKRLGRGGGYYDRFIEAYRNKARSRGWEPPLLVGLAYKVQVVGVGEEGEGGGVPAEQHDVAVDVLITEDEIRRWN